MYDIEPILLPLESSQASRVLPRLYKLLSSPVYPVTPPPPHTPLQVVHSSPPYFEAHHKAQPISVQQPLRNGISTPLQPLITIPSLIKRLVGTPTLLAKQLAETLELERDLNTSEPAGEKTVFKTSKRTGKRVLKKVLIE
jgi:hypothetical protein